MVSGSRPSRHWKSAECSLSTGSSSPPPPLHAASASSPAATRLSLFASASVTPRSSAQRVAPTPAKPTTAFRTTSGSRALEQLDGIAADLGVLDAVLGGELVERRRAGLRARRARARGARRRPRSPAGRSSRSPRGARRVSSRRTREGCLTRTVIDAVQAQGQRARSAKYAAGPAQSSESTRSSTPPWPAEQPPRVLHPRSRFTADSNRSPSVAASAITSAEHERLARSRGSPARRARRTRPRRRRACRRRSPPTTSPARSPAPAGAGRSRARRRTRPCRRRRP